MKIKNILLMVLGLFLTIEASAQIALKIALNRSVYMQYENIFACVTIRNDTGRSLIFGNDPKLQGFLLFDIVDSSGIRVPKIGDISATGLTLMPGEIKNLVIPVNKYYDLSRPDRYKINCFISHNLLPVEYKSRQVQFSVDIGMPYWRRTVGVPDVTELGAKVTEERTYNIRVLREKNSRYYYLTIEDEKNIYSICRLGKIFGQEKCSVEIDMFSRIHVLIPMTTRLFHYMVFNVDGLMLESNYWRTASTIPMLFRDHENGKVTRIGGEEARPGLDFEDPNKGLLTAEQLMRRNRKDDGNENNGIKEVKNGGIVDLGQGLEK